MTDGEKTDKKSITNLTRAKKGQWWQRWLVRLMGYTDQSDMEGKIAKKAGDEIRHRKNWARWEGYKDD